MQYTMHLDAEPYAKIANGSKTIELRLYDEKRRALKAGDRIVFVSEHGEAEVEVVALHVFADFDGLYAALDLRRCGYDEKDIGYARAEDMLRYYPTEEQRKWGVVGIEIRLIKEEKYAER